ncbi:SET domain-containing protein, partial [Aureobasidium melanogenum]|uniref:SET domain-containing protein n=1 Tax=Aureobasidium melanogenum (strain CBS 110374) TaxID=1043003 RepID=A0A074WSE0_AURM1
MEEDPLAYHKSVLKEEMLARRLRQAGDLRRVSQTREQLINEFASRPSPFSPVVRQIPRPRPEDFYRPCYLPLAQLKKIFLKDLKFETHHRGSFLLLRVFCQPFRKAAVMAAVEDETGDVDRVALFHTKEALRAFEVVPEGSVVSVKEPFYHLEEDGRYVLRVDHPSDMVVLDQHHKLCPEQWQNHEEMRLTALEWKHEGDKAFVREEYLEAHRCNTRGLARLDPDVDEGVRDLMRDLYHHRSSSNLRLHRYDATIPDAFLSTSNGRDDVSRSSDIEAWFRRGLANYQLCHYADALKAFERMLMLAPSSLKGREELKKTKTRLLEQQQGTYNFAEVIDEVTKNGFFADRASFISKTEVRQTQDRGRGLFASQDIRMGDLILCEKAFMAAHPDNRTPESTLPVWLNSVQKVIDNPSQSKDLLGLYAGEPRTSLVSAPMVDGSPVVDTFKVSRLLDLNGFSFVVGRESQAYGTSAMMTKTSPKSTGLWIRISNANHACLSNAVRSFIGDLIVLRAAKDIKSGEEITISYQNPAPLLEDRQKLLFSSWGFRCDCLLCTSEASLGVKMQTLADHVETSMAFMGDRNLNDVLTTDSELVMMAEIVAEDLEEVYADNLMHRLPCLGMADVWQWLSQTYCQTRNRIQLKRCATKILESYGYWITVQDSSITIDCAHGIPAVGVVEAMMYLSCVAEGEQKVELSQEFKTWARKVYEIVNGNMMGFELKY